MVYFTCKIMLLTYVLIRVNMEAENMPMTAKQMVRLLKKNGFVVVGQKGSHQKYKNYKTNRTVIVPMHPGDLGAGLEQAVLKQAGLDGEARK